MQLVVLLGRNKRPERPDTAISRGRKLTNELWGLIERCWSTDPTARPTADQVLASLPQVDDPRPIDTFDPTLPSRMSHEQANHPFALLKSWT